MGAPWYAHVSPLLHELYGLPICSLVQCKVLMLTYIKCFLAKKTCNCWDCLSPITSACPIRSDRGSMCWGLSMKQFHLVGPRRCPFSVTVSALWDSILPKIQMTLTQQPFGRFKIWFPPQGFRSEGFYT